MKGRAGVRKFKEVNPSLTVDFSVLWPFARPMYDAKNFDDLAFDPVAEADILEALHQIHAAGLQGCLL